MEAENKIKSDNYIQLGNDDDILILKIKDSKGNETGEYLEFNLEDIELPLRYQEIIEEDKKARLDLKNQLIIIDKKQDHKGKKLLSSKEEAKIKATRDFYLREEKIYNMFLGENGVKKLLNGKKLSWSSLDMIDDIIQKQILPYFETTADSIKKKIMKKYSDKRDDVIE